MTIRTGIITVSDRGARGERVDTSGPALGALCLERGWTVEETALIADDRGAIASLLRDWADSGRFDLVLTTGGTGLGPRDITPEATLEVVERLVPGLPEMMRNAGRVSTPMAALSRAVAGARGHTLIINLPGSERGARESLEAVADLLPHAVELLRGQTEHS